MFPVSSHCVCQINNKKQIKNKIRPTGKQLTAGCHLSNPSPDQASHPRSCTRSHAHTHLGPLSFTRTRARKHSFSDGFPNLRVHHSGAIRWTDCAFLASFQSPAVIFEQLSVIYALPKFLARSLKLLLPYFPTATMERAQEPGSIATARSLASMLSCVGWGSSSGLWLDY